MSNFDQGWTDEIVEKLKRLWDEGYSCSQIAEAIGAVSRSAVIGKVHRLGLPGRKRSPPAPQQRKVPNGRRTMKPRTTIANRFLGQCTDPVTYANNLDEAAERAADLAAAERKANAHNSPNACSFFEHTDGCRWPLGDPRDLGAFLFCNDPTEVKPGYDHGDERAPRERYCPYHTNLGTEGMAVRRMRAAALARRERAEPEFEPA